MAVSEGTFRLYERISPPLEAGDWRLLADQDLSAATATDDLDSADLAVEQHQANFRVRSPRYVLPPDQVLSTFPPAGSFGSYGTRLPQVVIKRRTLPWERVVSNDDDETPWLALVVIAEGEARIDTGVDVANCVTPGVELDGVADVAKGNCLVVRQSIVEKVFPTQLDVPLLAHAREVDSNDTELMMGDDDGYLAVVIANRLPVPGTDENGDEVPVTYLACLVNLEEQLHRLLPASPAAVLSTPMVKVESEVVQTAAAYDHVVMATSSAHNEPRDPEFVDDLDPLEATDGGELSGSVSTSTTNAVLHTSGTNPVRDDQTWTQGESVQYVDVYEEMASGFNTAYHDAGTLVIDPELRFPVLLHWSFTSSGSTTFRSLLEGLDSGLLGTTAVNTVDAPNSPEDVPTDTQPSSAGRLPLEVTESGHVGLEHRTRDGDEVRAWYRGPLLPHPIDASVVRLPLAHAADQLRIVIPDGREDLSLAAAFEIGRLLALSQPAVVAALMRWRQKHFHVGRRRAVVESDRPFWEQLLGEGFDLEAITDLGAAAGRGLTELVVRQPGEFVGQPRPRVTPGRPIDVDRPATEIVAVALGYEPTVLSGDLGQVLETLRDAPVPGTDTPKPTTRAAAVGPVRDHLHHVLDDDVQRLARDVRRQRQREEES